MTHEHNQNFAHHVDAQPSRTSYELGKLSPSEILKLNHRLHSEYEHQKQILPHHYDADRTPIRELEDEVRQLIQEDTQYAKVVMKAFCESRDANDSLIAVYTGPLFLNYDPAFGRALIYYFVRGNNSFFTQEIYDSLMVHIEQQQLDPSMLAVVVGDLIREAQDPTDEVPRFPDLR